MDMQDYLEFVKQLRAEGFDAEGDLFDGQVGVIVGPKGLDMNRMPHKLKALFFPLWELNDPANQQLFAERRFQDIADKRPPGWTPARNR